MDLPITAEHRGLLHKDVKFVVEVFKSEVLEPLLGRTGHEPGKGTSAFADLCKLAESLSESISNPENRKSEFFSLDDERVTILRAVIVRRRNQVATEIEGKLDIIHDEALKRQTERALEPYDELIHQPWFRSGKVYRFPRLADFLVIEEAKKHGRGVGHNRKRKTDEKFHILQAPQLFIPDFDRHRADCDLRQVGCAVAFVDIDEFREFNRKHTEPVVDMRVLPKFMRAIESHLFERGHGYRIGGDEYMLLIHNTLPEEGQRFVERLRAVLAGLTYDGIDGKTTVSIGLVHVQPGCFLTSKELRGKAAAAKAKAKEAGRNRIATYTDIYCEDLVVLPHLA